MHKSYTVKTQHFKYTLHVYKTIHPTLTTIRFYVGDSDAKNDCLRASLILPDVADDRIKDIVHICSFDTIESLEDCVFEYDNEHSFGRELLYSFINIVKANFPHITQIKLHDASKLPCDRVKNDTLDLISYSIALYGKTWYENVAGAYLEYEDERIKYNDAIKKYIHPDTKASIPYLYLYKLIFQTNKYTFEIINSNPEKYETMYKNANTFPEFFYSLSRSIPKSEKCIFFKNWLEIFIGRFVYLYRDWKFDIDKNNVLKNVLNVSSVRPMGHRTRKTRKLHRGKL